MKWILWFVSLIIDTKQGRGLFQLSTLNCFFFRFGYPPHQPSVPSAPSNAPALNAATTTTLNVPCPPPCGNNHCGLSSDAIVTLCLRSMGSMPDASLVPLSRQAELPQTKLPIHTIHQKNKSEALDDSLWEYNNLKVNYLERKNDKWSYILINSL